MEYVLKKRMALAERFLLDTDEPLRSVAEAVGFSDVEYFSRTFKRTHGLPPAAWRHANRA
jgi:AraC-like DNA-binding protein